ncbi:hypothetical protein FB451DRAFT_1388199 [Mycena latifolia]|nr:hypothetical protein FB451DRAFT_1388199 [Mycena latifolia]
MRALSSLPSRPLRHLWHLLPLTPVSRAAPYTRAPGAPDIVSSLPHSAPLYLQLLRGRRAHVSRLVRASRAVRRTTHAGRRCVATHTLCHCGSPPALSPLVSAPSGAAASPSAGIPRALPPTPRSPILRLGARVEMPSPLASWRDRGFTSMASRWLRPMHQAELRTRSSDRQVLIVHGVIHLPQTPAPGQLPSVSVEGVARGTDYRRTYDAAPRSVGSPILD